ncbi:ABC transporter ATP-binding protein [Metabacillus sp. RGM 3146]|uniref:ABC transporter ATP-binding protein n=1 Tax=Metabacillus sp. RGM 3146 TaxID=3401092 RepID=UPI003B9D55A3
MLKVEELSKTFHNQKDPLLTLDNISLTIEKGEFISILGPSGCGKSTLLDIIAGIKKPSKGRVMYGGREIIGEIGYSAYMPQSDVLLPWRTVLENAALPLEIKGESKKQAKKQAIPLFKTFGLKGFENHYPFMLSGGMRQRASFLRTLLNKKDLLLLDEPFGKLDAITRLELQQWLMDICSSLKLTVLFITHDIDEAIFLSDRVYIMSARPGKVMKELTVPFSRPRSVEITGEAEFAELKRDMIKILK